MTDIVLAGWMQVGRPFAWASSGARRDASGRSALPFPSAGWSSFEDDLRGFLALPEAAALETAGARRSSPSRANGWRLGPQLEPKL